MADTDVKKDSPHTVLLRFSALLGGAEGSKDQTLTLSIEDAVVLFDTILSVDDCCAAFRCPGEVGPPCRHRPIEVANEDLDQCNCEIFDGHHFCATHGWR